jgi:integrase
MPSPVLDKEANGRFYAYWSEGRRSRRKSMGTSDRPIAEQRFAHWLLLGGARAHRSGEEGEGLTYTVADCWKVYWEKFGKNAAGAATLEINWKWIEQHFGLLTVSEVTQDSADAYVFKRTTGKIGRVIERAGRKTVQKVKPQTCRKELSALFAAMHFCARKPQSMFSATIIEQIVLPEAGEPRDRWLRMEEMQRLLDAAAKLRRGDRLSRGERFLWLALETAARKQAILDLTWDRVDFETNTIHFDVPGRKKTKKKRAAVAISKALRPVLERAYSEREGKGEARDTGLVMDNKGAVWSTVQLIAIEAGFGGARPKVLRSEKPKATGISPHVLRHTAATHMARRGVPLWKIAKILGNTLAMVEKVYAKWSPDDPENTVDLISNGKLEAAE